MTAADALRSSLASAAGFARSLGLPEPNPSHVSLQSWCLNGRHLGQKRNARTNPAGTFVTLTVGSTGWTLTERGDGCEERAIERAAAEGYP